MELDEATTRRTALIARLVTADTERAPVPMRLDGTIDAVRGYGMHHLAAGGRVPLRDLVNYFINSQSAHLFAGDADNLNIRIYALDLASPLVEDAGHERAGADARTECARGTSGHRGRFVERLAAVGAAVVVDRRRLVGADGSPQGVVSLEALVEEYVGTVRDATHVPR